MSLPRETACTIEDIYALPDGQRAELIDGQMYMMAPPSYRHQRLVAQFTKILGQYIDSKKGDCVVLPAPFAVNLHADDETYVEPDINVICDKINSPIADVKGLRISSLRSYPPAAAEWITVQKTLCIPKPASANTGS